MEGYKAEIIESTRNLTVRERIAIKDTTNCKALDQVTFENGSVDIDYDYHVKLKIHNPLSDNPDYEKLVIVDKSGERYITGSKSLEEAMMGIVDEMVDAGEGDNIRLHVYRMESRNYEGKQFLTCSII